MYGATIIAFCFAGLRVGHGWLDPGDVLMNHKSFPPGLANVFL